MANLGCMEGVYGAALCVLRPCTANWCSCINQVCGMHACVHVLREFHWTVVFFAPNPTLKNNWVFLCVRTQAFQVASLQPLAGGRRTFKFAFGHPEEMYFWDLAYHLKLRRGTQHFGKVSDP